MDGARSELTTAVWELHRALAELLPPLMGLHAGGYPILSALQPLVRGFPVLSANLELMAPCNASDDLGVLGGMLVAVRKELDPYAVEMGLDKQ